MKIRLREFKQGDIEAIEDLVEPFATEEILKVTEGLSMTMTSDGKPVACGGVAARDEDSAEVWIVASKSLLAGSLAVRFRLLHALMEVFNMVIKTLDYPLLYAAILDGFDRGERLAKLFKFEKMDQTLERDGHTYHYYKRMVE